MRVILVGAAALLIASCGSSSSSSSDADPGNGGGTGGQLLTGQLSLNSVPSLNEAAGASAGTSLALLLNEAPNLTQLQEDFDTVEKRKEVFGESVRARDYCAAISGTARSLSKFLSEDSMLCMFREVDKGYVDGASYITLEEGEVGEEGIFGQAEDDKKVWVKAAMEEGTMDVYFDIPGTSSSEDAFQLTMRMCMGGNLSSVLRIEIERETRRISISDFAAEEDFGEDGAGAYHSNFVGYLLEDGSGWDLEQLRTYRLEHANEERYEALWTDFTAEGQIATLSTGLSDSGNSRDWYAVDVSGTTAVTLSVNAAEIKKEWAAPDEESDSDEIGMEFEGSQYGPAETELLKTLLATLPTEGRYYERDGAVTSELFDSADCEMSEPDAVFNLNMAEADEVISEVCDTILTDSEDDEVEGKTPVRSGMYCDGLDI